MTGGAPGPPFTDRHRALLDCLRRDPPPSVAGWTALTLPGTEPPWTDTGLDVAAGDALTLLAEGRVSLSAALDLGGPPRFHLWGRIGDGPIWNGSRDTSTRTCAAGGRLRLAVYQGEWASPQGDLATPLALYAAGGGALDVVAVRWRGDPAAGLDALAARVPDDPLVAAERAHLRRPVRPPEGWRYLWFLGESEIFAASEADGRPAIRIDAEGDVGIIQKPLDAPLGPDTRLAWRWRIDELPSRAAEDTLPTHDYVSLALEFDDGKDLTWYWSAALPVGTCYACPLPTWNGRETHVVVRSGPGGLGRWHAEARLVLDDHRAAIGGTPPRRIVAVWVIAVAMFQRGRARAALADVVLESAGRRLRVL